MRALLLSLCSRIRVPRGIKRGPRRSLRLATKGGPLLASSCLLRHASLVLIRTTHHASLLPELRAISSCSRHRPTSEEKRPQKSGWAVKKGFQNNGPACLGGRNVFAFRKQTAEVRNWVKFRLFRFCLIPLETSGGLQKTKTKKMFATGKDPSGCSLNSWQ